MAEKPWGHEVCRTMILQRGLSKPYVFIVGMNKTATTALHHFFASHGWPSVHYDLGRLAATMLRNTLRGRRVLQGYDRHYRVFSDMVFETPDLRFEANVLFPTLDRQYPGAYFILNTRDEDEWIASRLARYSPRHQMTLVGIQRRASGLIDDNEAVEKWRLERRDFESRVERYFADSPRFLKIDIGRDDVPARLSRLLDVEFDPSKWTRITTNSPRPETAPRVPSPLVE